MLSVFACFRRMDRANTMKFLIITGALSALALSMAGAAVGQTPPNSSRSTNSPTERGASDAQQADEADANARTAAQPGKDYEPHDRRLKALQGEDSTASPNIDAKAAANQVQIPDYPPVDADQVVPKPPAPTTKGTSSGRPQ